MSLLNKLFKSTQQKEYYQNDLQAFVCFLGQILFLNNLTSSRTNSILLFYLLEGQSTHQFNMSYPSRE